MVPVDRDQSTYSLFCLFPVSAHDRPEPVALTELFIQIIGFEERLNLSPREKTCMNRYVHVLGRLYQKDASRTPGDIPIVTLTHRGRR